MKTKSLCLHDSQNKPWLIKLPDNEGVGVERVRIQELQRLWGWEEAWQAKGTAGFLNHSCRGSASPACTAGQACLPPGHLPGAAAGSGLAPHPGGPAVPHPELRHTFTEGLVWRKLLSRCAPLPQAGSSLPRLPALLQPAGPPEGQAWAPGFGQGHCWLLSPPVAS